MDLSANTLISDKASKKELNAIEKIDSEWVNGKISDNTRLDRREAVNPSRYKKADILSVFAFQQEVVAKSINAVPICRKVDKTELGMDARNKNLTADVKPIETTSPNKTLKN